jgi:arsenate reductase
MASQQQTPITFLPPNTFLHNDPPKDAMEIPTVLFVCNNNAGRSQMAAAYVRLLGRGHVVAASAGPAPAEFIHPVVIEAMIEEGISLSNEKPKALNTNVIRNSNVLITMDCDGVCPFFNGVHHCDWRLSDPAGKTLDEVRVIRNQIRDRVDRLIGEMVSFEWR